MPQTFGARALSEKLWLGVLSGGCTELMQAAYKGDTKKAPTRFAQRTAMCFSAEVKALVDGGADINQQDAYGWTAVAGSDSVRDRQVECLRWQVRYAVRNRQGRGELSTPEPLFPAMRCVWQASQEHSDPSGSGGRREHRIQDRTSLG